MFGIDDALMAKLAPAGIGFVSGMLTNKMATDRADASNEWSAAQYASRYQTTVNDLKSAGLNPMLAYSQGGGSPPSAQQVQFQNPVSSAADAMRSSAVYEQSMSSAAQADAQLKQIDATVDKIKEETKNIPIEGQRLKYAIQLLAEQAALAAQQGQTQSDQQKVLIATVKKLKSETTLLDLDIDAAKLLDNLGRESKQLQPVVDVIRSLLRK